MAEIFEIHLNIAKLPDPGTAVKKGSIERELAGLYYPAKRDTNAGLIHLVFALTPVAGISRFVKRDPPKLRKTTRI